MLHPETTISSYNGAFVGELPLDQLTYADPNTHARHRELFGQLAARTNDLAVAEGRLSEVETLNLAGVAVRELNDAGLYRVNIMNAWFSNAQSIDPDYNYAGFLDWDGQTETQPMGHARSALHELHEGRLALARSIVSLTLKTHLMYREEGHFYPTSESVEARTSQHVKDLLRNDFGAELHPSYKSVALLALQELQAKSGIQTIDEELQNLQQRRYQLTPEYYTQEHARLSQALAKAHIECQEVWTDQLHQDQPLDERWTDIRNKIVFMDNGDEDTRLPVITDATHLMRAMQDLNYLQAQQGINWAHALRDDIYREANLVSQVRETLDECEKLGKDDVGTAMASQLDYRLHAAINYLKQHANEIESALEWAGYDIDGLPFCHYLLDEATKPNW